jgi:hypothetical protein
MRGVDPAEASALLDLFDKFGPVKNVTVPPGAPEGASGT